MSKTFAAMPTYDTYKDSGEGWKSFPLCAVTSPKFIKNYQNLELLSVYLNLGVIRFSEVNEKRTNATSEDLSNYQEVAVGDFVLNNQQAWRGSVGVSKYNGIISPAYLVLSLSPLIDVGFANYYFRDGVMVSQYLICSRGVGTIQRNLYWQELKRSVVTIPPLPEQTAIADFLDKKTSLIDEAVSVKEQQIILLKERKQILIQNAVTQGLNPNAPKRDSGVEWIGKIPKHWDIKKLRFLGSTQNGISAGADYFGSGYPFVSYSDVYNNRELPIMVKGLAQSSDIDRKQYSIEKGDVLFTRTSETVEEIGFASTCLLTIENATFSGFLIRFRPKTKQLFDGFSKFYFNAPMLRQYFVKEMNLVIRASLSQELLKNLPVLLPSLDEQREITTYIESKSVKIDQAIDLNKQQIDKLKEYKATLINSAVTGKIKVVDSSEGERA